MERPVFLHQSDTWWELYDKNGQLISIKLLQDYDLNEIIKLFIEIAESLYNRPVVILDIEEIYQQG